MILDPIGYKLIWRTHMKKIILILSLALMSSYASAHCGGCGTGDMHGEGEKCNPDARVSECKAGLVCTEKEFEYYCMKPLEEVKDDYPYSD